MEREVPSTTTRRNINFGKAEEIALRKFVVENGIDFSKIFREVKIQAFQGIDPVSDRSPIFDAYLNEIDREVFFEIRPQRLVFAGVVLERVYVMLSKIYHYRASKKNNAYLQLILVKYAGTDNPAINRVFDYFQAALNNNLLRISVVEFTEEETQSIYENP